MPHAEETGLSFRVGFLACGFNSEDNINNNNNNNNNNNIHLHSAFLLVIQSALQSVLIVINLMKYYNDIFVKNKS